MTPRRLRAGASALVAAVACAGGGAAPAGGGRPLSEPQDGVATFYAATGAGNCSYAPSPDDLMVAAMNQAQYADSAACGACLRVAGPAGAVVVRVVDRCPECAAGHLDLSREAFARVADPVAGRVAVRWQQVACDVAGPIAYHFKDGSSRWWTAIQVRNHRVPVRALEVRGADGAWRALARQEYNYFVGEDLGAAPLTLRVTAADGQQLVDQGLVIAAEQTVPGAAQFQ